MVKPVLEGEDMEKNTLIVLYPSPEIGHLVAMVELGKLILTHHPSFSITILISNPPYNTGITAPYISHISATVQSINFRHLPTISLPPNYTTYKHIEQLAFELPSLNNPNLHLALETISTKSIIKALIVDFFCTAACEVAENLDIPTYFFFTSSASALAGFFYLPTIHETTTKSLKDMDIYLDIPGLPPIHASQMPAILFDRGSAVYNCQINTSTHMAKSKAVIINTFQELETRAIKSINKGHCIPNAPTPPIFCIGPVIAKNENHEAKHECLRWLDSQPVGKVVFLCFGSRGLFSAKQLKEIAIGLEKSGQRFLWVVRSPPTEESSKRFLAPPAPDLDILLPESFLDRTKYRGLVVKSWAPQADVLNHESVGGFVTHCGWNSVLESVWAGVPMVAWPLYAEQRMTSHVLVEEIKVALGLGELEDGFVSSHEFEERVRELMESERGGEIRERVMVMRDGAVAAMGKGGSSHIALAKLVEFWNQGCESI